ncbi:hypothetical protein [Peribacillus simplex]|uniref:hypothetical protein n=1 Tax=Peribacillus simplex TaxID=1478 RepID=UPI0024C0883A|nr:hypothetical protein [Peribacillus simplex]WHY96070.1 hypothetical protein QNH37_19045 [Peribacillus simplex]
MVGRAGSSSEASQRVFQMHSITGRFGVNVRGYTNAGFVCISMKTDDTLKHIHTLDRNGTINNYTVDSETSTSPIGSLLMMQNH